MRTRYRRARAAEGAVAVEFALVAPILFLLLFGILQYGMYFFDAHGTRTGVREAAREGVVKTFAACGGESAELPKLRCTTKGLLETISGPSAVKVYAPNGWQRGKPLVVCAMVRSEGGIGLLPMPNDGLITSKTQMSIEVVGASTPNPLITADSPLSGADWTWC